MVSSRLAAGLAALALATGTPQTRAAEPDAAAAPPGDPGPAAAAPAPDALEAERLATRARFLRLLDAGRNDEAVGAGRALVDLTRRQFGPRSPRLATPLVNLGTAQLRAGELPGAIDSYTEAIVILEADEGILTPRLINPLLGLGETFGRSGRYGEAIAAYERALRVNQVNEGLYNPDQFPIRDGLTEGYLGLGQLEKANFQQEVQVRVQARKLGDDNAELAPAIYKLGRWYERSGQPERARFVYQRAARIIEQDKGENAPELIDALIAIGDTYKAQALLPPDPNSTESPLGLLPLSSAMYRRALAIIDQQAPPDLAKRGQTYVALGDLYLLWNRRSTAEQAYGKAWEALAGTPELLVARDGYFTTPLRLMGTTPPRIFPRSATNRPPDDPARLQPGFVVVGFDVDSTGKAVNARVLESDPPGLLDDAVLSSVRNALHRPRYTDGAPAVASNQVYRHEFRYLESRLEPKPVEIPEGGRIGEPTRSDLPEPGAPLPPP